MVPVIVAWLLIQAIHASHGPAGFVAWVQPPGIAAGIGLVHGHVVAWLQAAH
jgi:hypothetical protein